MPPQRQRQYEQLFALYENARAELAGAKLPPPNVIEPQTAEDIADGWETHDWLQDNWTQAGGGQLTEEEEEFLRDMRHELERS